MLSELFRNRCSENFGKPPGKLQQTSLLQQTHCFKIGKNGKTTSRKKKCRQTGGFLNRYNFAYAGRDTVNQVRKIALKIITKATSDINKIAKDRIGQIVRTGGAEIERIAPKIIKGAIEEVYKTPFRFLGNLGKKHFQKNKNKTLQIIFIFFC